MRTLYTWRLIPVLLLFVALASGCWLSDKAPDEAQEDLPAPGTPGEPITMSADLKFAGVPAAVVPYGDQEAETITLSDFTVEKDGGAIIGTLAFEAEAETPFTLVVYTVAPEQLLTVYFDAETRLTLAEPAGSSGNVAFSVSGFEVEGEPTAGTLSFSFATEMSGVYRMAGTGEVYVFCVAGQVNPRSTLPGSQQDAETFQASSNVLTAELSL